MAWQNWFTGAKLSAAKKATDNKAFINNSSDRILPSAWLLEPRMLFDGAIAATVADTAASTPAADAHATAIADSQAESSDSSHTQATADNSSDTATANDQSQTSDTPSDAVATSASYTRHEVVFIDTSLKDYQTLVDGIQPGVEIVLIDGSKDGLQQIADWASTHSGYDAIHIFSHGSEGTLNLGSTVLTDTSIKSADVQAALAIVGQALTAEGDLLLYGCDVGAGKAGDALLTDLATATGADVAASSDATGSSLIGGDWVLEKTVGDIDTAALHVDGYQGVMTVLNFNESQDDIASGANLSVVRVVDGQNITFSSDSYLGLDSTLGPVGIYSYDGASGTSATKLVISAPTGYTFDLSGLSAGGYNGILHFVLTYADGSTSAFDVSMDPAALSAISSLPSINDVTQVVISSASFSVLQDINIVDVKQIGPTVSAVSSSTADGAYKAGSTVLVSVDFSTAVTVNTTGGTPTLLLETGATDRQATYVSGSGTSTLVFSYVVQSGDQSADLNYVSSSSLVLNGATISDSSSGKNASVTLPDAGALTSLGGAKNIVIDTQLPTATVSLSDTALTIGETATVTITFSEKVSDFSNADLTVSGGTLSAVSSADGGTTWTGTFTPTNGTTTSGNQITLNMTGVQDAAGNSGSGTVSSASYAVDTVRPTASIVVADSTLIAGETSLVTITFSEAVTGLTNTDLSIANGTLSTVSSSDGGLTWTATFTPNTTVQDTTNIITLDNTGVADQAGNAGTGTTDSNNYSIDTQRPTASIVMADNALRIGETSLVTITFSEAVSGFTNQDLNIVNGTLTAVSSADGGITWTATFTPTSNVTDATNLISLDNTGVADMAGNAGTGATDSNIYRIDTQRPTATVVLSDTVLSIGETSLVTITFSEAVTGFTNQDLTIVNGTMTNVSSADGGVTWTATFTPVSNVTETSNVITLDNSGVADTAGNSGVGTTDSNNYSIDTQRPTATVVMADTELTAGETSLVTITFSEAVTGFTNADLTVPNGTLTTVTSSDGGITWTAIFTPNTQIHDATNIITLAQTGVSDLAGNTGTGTSDSANFTISTLQPTATIVVADNALRVGETSLVTITFSEAVTGFTNQDLTIANGTLSAVSSADGGITWTATFTPTSSVTDNSNIIVLDNSGVQNAVGTAGSGTTHSNNYAIDTVRPTATIVVANDALGVDQTSLVTITFSEAVTGFSNVDLVVNNGTLSAVSSSDGGITWTATLTPTSGISANSNMITLNNQGVTDQAGNTGIDFSYSNNYVIDSQRPTATLVVSDNALTAGETSLVTITFSEAVTDFDNSDLSVSNGTLSAVSSSDGGITWTATFTPNQNIQDATNLIRLNNSGVLDFAGNVGVGTTESLNYSINTVRPTATIVMADHSLLVGETSLVTITFSEAVSGFNNGDLNVNNGTLSSVSSSDGGITWTATFTPGSNVTDSSNIITLDNSGVFNAAGNAGVGITDSNNYAIDTQRPTATIVVGNPNIGIGGTSQVTFTFNEAVSGFDLSDVSIANGTLSNLTSADGGITWTATLTPTSGATDTTNLVVLDTSELQDLAGNTGSGIAISNNYAVDATPPVGTITLSDSQLTAGETAQVTITFNEAVTGFSNSSLTVSNGTLSAVSSSDGGKTWTATFTPAAGIAASGNLIVLDNSGVTDLAGNTGSGSSSSPAFSIDSRPVETGTVTMAMNAQFMLTDGMPGASIPTGGEAPRSQIDLIALPAASGVPLTGGASIFGAAPGISTTPSAAIVFSQTGQGGGAAAPSALAAVFSQNDVNHYEPGIVRSQVVDLNQPMGGRSTLAGLFGDIPLPGSTALEVFSGSSWQNVSDNTLTGTIAPTSVFGAPVFSQQLQWLDEVQSQQVASLEVALKNNKSAV